MTGVVVASMCQRPLGQLELVRRGKIGDDKGDVAGKVVLGEKVCTRRRGSEDGDGRSEGSTGTAPRCVYQPLTLAIMSASQGTGGEADEGGGIRGCW